MREILFRGKRTDGVWVDGYFFAKPILEKYFIIDGESQWMVNPSTVGQCTGLTDANGKRIFEGDFVKMTYAVNGRKKVILKGLVQYEEGAFYVHTSVSKQQTKGLLYGFTSAVHTEDEGLFCKVIGNIHDNPELLEGK